MSNYSQITSFTPKDALITGNPLKLLRGSEFDAEFAAIATAIATKLDSASVPVGANPSATIGLSATNGAAATFMRSDAAPALSQSIAPTWSATHTFTTAVSGGTAPILLSSASPGTVSRETDAAANTQYWRTYINGGQYVQDITDDAFGTVRNWLVVSRATGAISSLVFGNATNNPTYQFLGTGTSTFGGPALLPDGSTSNPAMAWANNTNTGLYRNAANSVAFAINGAFGGEVRFIATNAQLLGSADGAAAPYHSWNADADSGLARIGADQIGLVTGGTSRLTISTTAFTGTLPWQGQDGSVGTPALSYSSDATTGFYRTASGDVSFSAANSRVFRMFAAASGGAQVADFGGTLQTVGFREVPQNSQSANYTLVLADSGKHILHPNGGGAGDTFTIPANASVAYALGTAITFINRDSNSISIAITSDTLVLANSTSTGTRTLAQNGVATAVKVESTLWVISGTGLT